MTDLYGGADMARVLYGQHARQVPAWFYVQDQGPGVVSLVGASMTPGQDHPLTYGGGHHHDGEHGPAYWPHHLIVGEVIVRPHVIIGTRALQGAGLGGLATGDYHDIEAMLADGRLIAGTSAQVAEIVHRSRRGAWRDA